jgi:hypothetical protein
MKQNQERIERIERALRDAFLLQPLSAPSEAWHAEVLARVRAEVRNPATLSLFPIDRIAWRIAILAAAAAVIVSFIGYERMPSEGQLAWEWNEGGCVMEWLTHAGG